MDLEMVHDSYYCPPMIHVEFSLLKLVASRLPPIPVVSLKLTLLATQQPTLAESWPKRHVESQRLILVEWLQLKHAVSLLSMPLEWVPLRLPVLASLTL